MPKITIKFLQEEIEFLKKRNRHLEDTTITQSLKIQMYEEMRKKSPMYAISEYAQACANGIDASAHTVTALTQLIERKLR